jgi:hypothetical protein
MNKIYFFFVTFVVLCFGAPLFAEQEDAPFWRVIYNTRGWIPPEASKADLEYLYGGKVKILPQSGNPQPKHPKVVPGPVFSKYPLGPGGDAKFIVSSTSNPGREWHKKVEKWNKVGVPGHLEKFDIEDKRGEAKFIEYVSPELAPTPTISFEDYNKKEHDVLSDEEKAEIEKRVEEAMEKENRRSPKIKADLIQMETLRRTIHKEIGKSIIKTCLGCGSEGILPMTHKDQWIDNYLDYLRKGDDHEGFGEVLKDMLAHPEAVLLQKMVDKKYEVRFHVVNGKILEDATFPRYYPEVGEYIPDSAVEQIHNAVKTKFLDRLVKKLGPDFENFQSVSDAILTEDGRVQLIDLNAGVDSGFYNPWEDLITINRHSAAIAGKNGQLLKDWEAIHKLPIGSPEKVSKIKEFLERIKYFIDDHNQDQYWGRLAKNYRKLLEKTPTARQFNRALEDLKEAGMNDGKLFLQFINHVQGTVVDENGAPLRLSHKNQKLWQNEIERLSPEIQVSINDSKLTGAKKAPATKKSLALAKTARNCAALGKLH